MVQWESTISQYTAEMVGHVLILEAASGVARQNMLQQWLQSVQPREQVATWLLPCNFQTGGAWAGLQDFLQDLVSALRETAPELISKHSYELCLAAPILQQSIQVTHPSLTDIAPEEEHVRNYPLDRAYRSLHGLVDFLEAWHRFNQSQRLVVVCDEYDHASKLVQRFFTELMRRRGTQLQLTLLLAVEPGYGPECVQQFIASPLAHAVRLKLPEEGTALFSQESIIAEAEALECQIRQNPKIESASIPRVVHLWEQSTIPERALPWKIQAMQYFNRLGLYELSYEYCQEVAARLDEVNTLDETNYMRAAFTTFFCYLSLGYAEQAQQVLQEKLLTHPIDQVILSHCYYFLGMLHARFLPRHDYPLAVQHLEHALTLINEEEVPEDKHHFYSVFLKNGLAYVRFRQGYPAEAIEICRDGIEELQQHLRPDRHQLHRSVLFYNIAQVYAATGPYEEALAAYTAASEMDPHYSEYLNERGTIYFKMGRLVEAEHDYHRAIELSPPYSEVWTNLGQCYRAMERMEDAVAAYTRALDLNPDVILALVGRAEAYASLGQLPEALADYRQALVLDPKQPEILASRAIIYYELGDVARSRDDLDTAIRLSPQEAVFYQNRATALLSLNCPQQAVEDLRTYLHLCPDADDRAEVEQQLAGLAI